MKMLLQKVRDADRKGDDALFTITSTKKEMIKTQELALHEITLKINDAED